MGERFTAVILNKDETDKTASQTLSFEDLSVDDLMPGDVVVDVEYSTLNYKDGLVITGAGPVVRRWPMIPGIDFAGTVSYSDNPQVKAGDKVLVNGYGLSENHYGGYAQKARVPAEWLVPVPANLSTKDAMAIGTAGYTAMLAVLALEDHGVMPSSGPVLVTGAAGGVGSVATTVLAKLGFEVIASTGRTAESDYLKYLGASQIIERSELSEPGRPLGKERWAGAVDSVGSTTLANALAMTRYAGTVAACGLAGGADLPATVMPFILRGITLAGIDSVMAPPDKRLRAWARLARDLDLSKFDQMISTIALSQIEQAGQDILAGKIRGRTVVDVHA